MIFWGIMGKKWEIEMHKFFRSPYVYIINVANNLSQVLIDVFSNIFVKVLKWNICLLDNVFIVNADTSQPYDPCK